MSKFLPPNLLSFDMRKKSQTSYIFIMKKYLFLTLAMFAAIALQSCNTEDGDNVPPVDYDVDTVSAYCEGIYFGDAYFSNDEVYTHYLRIGDLPMTDDEDLDAEGTYYVLRLNSPLEEFPAAGTYEGTSSSDKYTEYTILTDISSVVYKRATKSIEEITMNVSTSGGEYSIEITATTTDGETFHTVYTGDFLLVDKSIEWMAEDMNTPMTTALAWYLEDNVDYKNTNLNITLYENVDEAGWLVAPSSVLVLVGRGEFNDDGELLPGSFSIVSGDATDNSFTQGECVNFLNAPFPAGSNLKYYYDASDSSAIQVGLAESGTVDIQKNGDEYTITYELKTTNGKTLTGSYTGPLVVEDAPKVVEKNEWDLPEDHAMEFTSESLKVQAFSDKWTVEGATTWALQFKQFDSNWNYWSDQLNIQIVNTLEDTEEPVAGHYEISATDEVGTARVGTYTKGDYSAFGTGTYFEYFENGEVLWAGAASAGYVDITKNSDGTYTIEFDFLDGQQEPKHFSGSWTGKLDI